MESKKCPLCGKIMRCEIINSAINYYCDSCEYSEASTYYDPKIWDVSEYSIILKSHKDIDLDQIKLISHLTGLNFILSKKLLNYGGFLCKITNLNLDRIKKSLDDLSILYEIKNN